MYLLSRQPPSLLFMLKKKIRCIFLENPNKITILSLQLVQESTILLHQQLTHTRTIQLVIQPTSSPLFSLFNPLEFVHAFMPSCSGASNFYVYVLQIVAGPFLLFLLAIVLPNPLRYTDSDYPYGIFKLFFERSKQKPYIQGHSEESKRKDRLQSTIHFIET